MSEGPRSRADLVLRHSTSDGRTSVLFGDIVLMVALSEGFLSQLDFDQVARLVLSYREMARVPWEVLERRRDVLELDSPLFADAREHLVERLPDPRDRRVGLSLAAKLIASRRPLIEEERAILRLIAKAFEIPDRETEQLIQPWPELEATPERGRVFSSFNIPSTRANGSIFDALGTNRDDAQTRLVVHKLHAVRSVIDNLLPAAELIDFGDAVPVGPYQVRLDALIQSEGRWWPARFLADNESMHPLEHDALSTLVSELDDSATLLFAHTGTLSKSDRAFFRTLDGDRIRVAKIEV